MNTLLYSHPSCVEHNPGSYHPESPDRLRAVMQGLEAEDFQYLERHEAPEVDLQDVERVHRSDYVQLVIDNVPKEGRVHLDADTAMSPMSLQAARHASGAVVAAVDAVMAGKAKNAFCAVRPPGHHAESGHAMGFCLFNAAAIGAFHAGAKHDLKRVAVVDFDVHHGNGTQHSFEAFEGLFYGSSHQYPFYPGSGAASETGVAHNICNVPLEAGSGTTEFRAAYNDTILPALRDFDPELLIISAGFDAHARDPLAQLRVQTDDYLWVTRKLLDVADECCDGRVVSTLEGGYDLQALKESSAIHVKGLMER